MMPGVRSDGVSGSAISEAGAHSHWRPIRFLSHNHMSIDKMNKFRAAFSGIGRSYSGTLGLTAPGIKQHRGGNAAYETDPLSLAGVFSEPPQAVRG